MDFSFRNLKKFVSDNFLFDESKITNDIDTFNKNNIINEKEVVKVYIHIYYLYVCFYIKILILYLYLYLYY